MEKLVATDTVSRQQFDDARDKRDAAAQRSESLRQRLAELQAGTRVEDLHAAEARYRQAQAAAVLARKGFRKEDIEAARGKLAEAKGHVAELDVRLKEAELHAPTDAVIEVVSVRPGDLVPAGRIVVTMLEASQLWVKVYLPETKLARVHTGQKAAVRVDGFSRLIPARYYIRILRGIVLRGVGASELWPNAAVLTVMGCAAILLAARQFVRQKS